MSKPKSRQRSLDSESDYESKSTSDSDSVSLSALGSMKMSSCCVPVTWPHAFAIASIVWLGDVSFGGPLLGSILERFMVFSNAQEEEDGVGVWVGVHGDTYIRVVWLGWLNLIWFFLSFCVRLLHFLEGTSPRSPPSCCTCAVRGFGTFYCECGYL